MCLALAGLILEVLTLGGALLANGHVAWKKGPMTGGLWGYCPPGRFYLEEIYILKRFVLEI